MHSYTKKDARRSNTLRLAREMVAFGRRLHGQGFVAAADGNLSVRIDEDSVLITPTAFCKADMKPADMVRVDRSGNRLVGRHNPSCELAIHLTIYRMRPEIGAVVHAHPCTATAFAAAGMALDEPLCSEAVITLGSVPLAPYATPGTDQLAKSLEPFVKDHNAILMANHGVVTYAKELSRAYMMMEAVEHYARIVLAARQLGGASKLTPDDREKLLELRARYLMNCTA